MWISIGPEQYTKGAILSCRTILISFESSSVLDGISLHTREVERDAEVEQSDSQTADLVRYNKTIAALE